MKDHTSWWVTKKIIFQHMSDVQLPPAPPYTLHYTHTLRKQWSPPFAPCWAAPALWLWNIVCVTVCTTCWLYMVILEQWGGWPCTPCPPLSRTRAVGRSTWLTSHLGCWEREISTSTNWPSWVLLLYVEVPFDLIFCGQSKPQKIHPSS